MQGKTIFCISCSSFLYRKSEITDYIQAKTKLQRYLNFVLYISKHSELRYKYHVLHYLLPRVDTCNCCITRLIYKWREE